MADLVNISEGTRDVDMEESLLPLRDRASETG